jgi:hypothetical protein
MFGDIVINSNNYEYKGFIRNFMTNIAYSGGYLFHAVGKNFEDVHKDAGDSVCYHIVNTVPDFNIQYKRGGTTYSTYTKSGFVVPNDVYSGSYLTECISSTIDEAENIPYLNYNSAVYYYTTCMAFGLVDSVQKNLNIKTWNGKTFGLFFYDMDTSLGTANDGGDTSYFCFSDFWDNEVEEILDDEGKVKETILKGATIVRDYYPESHQGIVGYDVPSSYLFAICKYAASMPQYKTYLSPQTVYGRWRQKGGALENSQAFIDRYYANNLKDIPGCLLNLNYRTKFLYKLTGESFSTEYEGLKGTKIEKTKE